MSLHLQFSGDEPSLFVEIFDPAPVPAASYPDDLPFLAGCAANILRTEGVSARTVIWERSRETDDFVDEIVAQSLSRGWVKEPDRRRGPITLVSGSRKRIVAHLPMGPLWRIAMMRETAE